MRSPPVLRGRPRRPTAFACAHNKIRGTYQSDCAVGGGRRVGTVGAQQLPALDDAPGMRWSRNEPGLCASLVVAGRVRDRQALCGTTFLLHTAAP
ncbi:hypothetical protein GCM10010254_22870 [Streptomyces chromofuscus]|nr:hypothetical protein GCM10010254_22870 [Streptomyces chromofuscus]